MKTYNSTCAICNITLVNSGNSLANHIFHSHKNITKEEYYKTYIDSRTTCINCNKELKFKNIHAGYGLYCKSCAIKIKQWDTDQGTIRRQLLSDSMINNTYSIGRPLGSKNKNPYPSNSPLVQQRIKNTIENWRSINHWHNVNMKWWSTASDEARDARIRNWLNGGKKHDPNLNLDMYKLSEKSIEILNKIFDME